MDHVGPRTLAVDCGGGGIKSSVLDAAGFQISAPQRTALKYPLSPQDLMNIIALQIADAPKFERITLGMPGMIRRGVVVYTPHYIRRAGPHTRIDPQLAEAWDHLDMRAWLEATFHTPALVLNDAEVAAAGVVSGEGAELVLTLGTGLGTTLIDSGILSPHLEISHAPLKWGKTYDDVLGEAERLRLGDIAWSRRVLRAIDSLWPVYRWDKLYVGGGNSAHISASVATKIIENYAGTLISNTAGMNGGARAWAMIRDVEPDA